MTRLYHQFYGITEQIRKKCFNTDKIIASLELALIKNKTNQKFFLEVTGITLSGFPVIIQW